MDLVTLESLAVEFYRRHRFDPEEPTSTFKLARAELGPDAITRPPSLLGSYPASLYGHPERQRIALRRTVPQDEEQFYVGHELGHRILGVPHGCETDIETACDYLGAALMAPRPAVIALYRSFGWDVSAIAEHVVATQTWAGMRLAEALLVPLAAVSPTVVRVRGPECWAWPSEPEIRRLAKSPGPGLRKVRVTDRPRRVLLVGDGSL